MSNNTNYIFPISSITIKNKTDVGVPPLELAELMSANVPIPPGFVITQSALEYFAYTTQLDLKVKQLQQMGSFSESTLTKLILESDLPKEVYTYLSREYSSLAGITSIWMRLRAGLYDAQGNPLTFIDESDINDVKGFDALELELKKIWAKLLIIDQKYDSLGSFVIVQKLIPAEISGKIYTKDLSTENDDQIIVKCMYGEYSDDLIDTSDVYVFSKKSEKIIDRTISQQLSMKVRSSKKDMGFDDVEITDKWKMRQKLNDKYIEDLGYLGDYLENVFTKPQEVSWVFQAGKIWINYVKPLVPEITEEEKVEVQEIEKDLEALNNIVEKEAESFEEEIVDIILPEENLFEYVSEPEIEIPEATSFADNIENIVESDTNILDNNEEKYEQFENISEIIDDKSKDNLQNEDIDLSIRSDAITKDVLVVGIGNNKGIIKGKIIFDREKSTNRDVLVLSEWDGMPKNAAALIIEDMLNVRSEIPVVYGAELASKILREGEFVQIDTDTGFVFELQNLPKQVTEPIEQAHEKEMPTIVKSKDLIQPTKVKTVEPEIPDEPPVKEKKIIPIKKTKKEVEPKKTEVIVEKKSIKNEKIHTAIKVFSYVASSQIKDDLSLGDGLILDLPHMEDYISGKERMDYKNISSLVYNYVLSYLKNTKDNVIYNVYDATPSIYLKNSEMLEVQCEAIHKLRNKENMRNLNIALPKFKNIKQLREFRKSLSASGLRRSTTFKVYIKVAYSSNIFELSQYLDDRFDGVIVNLDTVYNSLYSSEKKIVRVTDTLLTTLAQIQKECKAAKVPMIMDLKGIKLSESALNKISPFLTYGVSVAPKNLNKTKEFISDIEKQRIFK
ncbi:MAG: PEP/pyruvate-binding domain-containing protein [bacterium]